jgi:hypothetical protein
MIEKLAFEGLLLNDKPAVTKKTNQRRSNERREEKVVLMLSKAEKESIVFNAKRRNLSVSAYVAHCILYAQFSFNLQERKEKQEKWEKYIQDNCGDGI